MTEKVYVVSHFNKYNITTYSHFYNWLLCCRVVNCDFGRLLYKSQLRTVVKISFCQRHLLSSHVVG